MPRKAFGPTEFGTQISPVLNSRKGPFEPRSVVFSFVIYVVQSLRIKGARIFFTIDLNQDHLRCYH